MQKNKQMFQIYILTFSLIFLLYFSHPLNAQNNASIIIYDYSNISGYNPAATSICSYNSSVCEETKTESAISLLTAGIAIFIKGAVGIFASLVALLLNIILMFLVNVFFMLISYFPDLSSSQILCEYNKVYSLVASFYSIALVIVGLYWIFGATSSSKRVQAKEYTELLFFLVLAESVSPFLFQLLVELSISLTKVFLNQEIMDAMSAQILGGSGAAALIQALLNDPFGLLVAIASIILIILLIFVVLFRNIMVVITYIIFPITIFLYLIPFTRRIGEAILKYTLLLIFSSFIIGLIIFAGVVAKSAVLGPFGIVGSALGSIFSGVYFALLIYILYKVLSGIVLGGLSTLFSEISGGAIGPVLPSISSIASTAATVAPTLKGISLISKGVIQPFKSYLKSQSDSFVKHTQGPKGKLKK